MASVRLLTATRSTLREVGPHFVIAPPGAEEEGLAAALAPLRPVPGTLVVLAAAADAAPVLREQLPELALIAAARGADTLLVAASGLAAPGPRGRRPAEQLADLAGLTVVGPDGPVSIEPDGSLRTSGSWWRCPPARRGERLGERWPEAAVTPLPAAPTPTPAPEQPATDPTVTRLPAGYWLTSTPPTHTPPVLHSAAPTPDTLLLVLGQPEHPALPSPHQLATVAATLLPTSPGRLLLSAPWAAPAPLVELAALLAASLDREVHTAIGLPVRSSGGDSAVLLDQRSMPGWEPCLTELTASPGSRTVSPRAWRARPGSWRTVGPALFDAFPGWLLEAVPAGLWLRPAAAVGDRAIRLRRPDPGQPMLIVGSPNAPVPQEVWDHLGELLAELPLLGLPLPALLVTGAMDAESEAVARFSARMYKLRWVAPDLTPPRPTAEPAPVPADPPTLLLTPAPPEPVPTPTEAPATETPPSTDRQALQALLAPHYHRWASRAEQLATRLPSLRSHPGTEDLLPDLVAVLLHHLDSPTPATRAELAEAARSAGPDHPLRPYLNCLAAGLRRLPSHHGAVLLAAPAGPIDLARYAPGAVLTEPAPISGLTSPDVLLDPEDPEPRLEFAIWSTSARRTTVFGDPTDEPAVVFPPNTRFTVLKVEPADFPSHAASSAGTASTSTSTSTSTTANSATPARVLLHEHQNRPTPPTPDRLLAWLARRDAVPVADRRPVANPERYRLTNPLGIPTPTG
ncbi:hypothetical protein [Kitasatospora azatica]|uniref:hypothetical protein n=1 Tax=Kitasatospora azatica TaxID=58347 RepID=UPI00055CDAF4|nr:hypothetical protein [Kitasatospora azatica]